MLVEPDRAGLEAIGELAAGQAKPGSSSRSIKRPPGDLIDPPHRSFEKNPGVRSGQPVTGGTQLGTIQGHRRDDHEEGA
jgi:hypothetical protein